MQVRGPGYRSRGGVDLEGPLGKFGRGAPLHFRLPLLEVQSHPHSFFLSQGSLCRARPVS